MSSSTLSRSIREIPPEPDGSEVSGKNYISIHELFQEADDEYVDRFVERFFEKIEIPDDPEECWVWTAYRIQSGCGQIDFCYGGDNHKLRAHRVTAYLAIGRDITPWQINHSCPDGENAWCVNPNHIYLGTASDNTEDAIENGRRDYCYITGEDHGGAKLSDDEVVSIREAYSQTNSTQADLADEFGVSRRQIGHIVNYRQRIEAGGPRS